VTRWTKGEAEVEKLIREGALDRVRGAQADGAVWLERSRRILASAEGIAADDPESSYVLVYDAARHVCVSLLAQQGIRATSKGGHYAVELVVRAQFGPAFRDFGTLRRRRNELEYPAFPGESVEPHELAEAITVCRRLDEAAVVLLPELSLF
jgi:hypothetical protein